MITKFTTTKKKYIENTQANPNTNNTFEVSKKNIQKVVEKPNKCEGFWTQFFSGGTTPTVLQQTVSATYCPPFGKAWLTSVCWSPAAGNEVKRRIYGGWVKTHFKFEAVCDQSTCCFEMIQESFCSSQRMWPLMYTMLHSKDIGH